MTTATLTPKPRTKETEVTRWSPFESLLSPVFPGFNRLFEDFWNRRSLEEDGLITPAIDVTEDETEITVSAELPGLEKADVKIQFESGMLTISGETTEEQEKQTRTWHRLERRHGAFRRSIGLPASVDVDGAEAEMKNGVLTVRLPLREEAKPKVLKIR